MAKTSTSWKRGHSGNPGGRPKTGKILSDRLRQALEASDGKRARSIIKELLKRAEGGDLDAIKIVFDRLEGKPTQRHEIDYLRREAERLAEKYGLNPDAIVREAEQIVKESR